jgi:hypothetical protein
LILVLPDPTARASEIGQVIADQVHAVTYRHYLDNELYTHYGDDRAGGGAGAEHDPARDNIFAVFQSFGLQVELHPVNGGQGYNVVATQLGTVYPAAQYVAGAHYDSVYNPGADDDASGVAGLLEAARILSLYETEYTIKYIAFDLEEWGLVGSWAYVLDHWNDDIRGMVQMDMIAWNYGGYACNFFRTQDLSLPLINALGAAVDEYGNGLTWTIAYGGASDHASFEDAGFPAGMLIEDDYYANPCYHLACDSVDTPGYIDYYYAADMVRSVAGFLADHAVAQYPYDCDGDGVPDQVEIQADPSLDCNNNGVLDTCEMASEFDCNNNGMIDACDVLADPSLDCNGNGMLDLCELQIGGSLDCNNNDVPDECDITNETSQDCNGNGVPDECEPDTCGPDPNPTTWQTPPVALSTSELTMTATAASDETLPIEYFFFYWDDGSEGGDSSGWQESTAYNDDGLAANTVHTYSVNARDGANPRNYSTYSLSVSTATHIEAPTGLAGGEITSGSVEVTATGTFTNLTLNQSGLYFEWELAAGGDPVGNSGWVQTTTVSAGALAPETAYTFRVRARNQDGIQTASAEAVFTTVPQASCVCLGDLNSDTVVDGRDIAMFVEMFLGALPVDSCADLAQPTGGPLDLADLQGFVVGLLNGPGCP